MRASDVKRTPSGRLTYRGETFSGFNKPKRSVKGNKKSVVLAKKGDEVKLVRFGDANMSIKKNIPFRKSNYCSRSSGIKGAKDKFSANYWSRRAWNC